MEESKKIKLLIPGFFSSKLKRNGKRRYKLQYINSHVEVKQTKEFIEANKKSLEENLRNIKEKYKEIVKRFYMKINSLPHINKTNFKRNIEETEILESNLFENKELALMGFYDVVFKKLQIPYNNMKKIYHELLHLSSSYYDEMKGIIYSGFEQYNKNTKQYIGRGITEGYTELLEKRYFNTQAYENGESYYFLEQEIVDKLEYFIGKEQMETAYFNADLNYIINELRKYSSLEESLKFIKIVDFIHKYANKNNLVVTQKIYIKKLYNEINIYLIKVYMKKFKLYSKIKNLNQDAIEDNLINYYNKKLSKISYNDIIFQKLKLEKYYNIVSLYFDNLSEEFKELFVGKSTRCKK
ncbi:MAG: hypothetical protein IJD92_03570 [Bacilli bacterium]|nr:hypothetical protein [Bacilli bacterium]